MYKMGAAFANVWEQIEKENCFKWGFGILLMKS